MIPVEQRTFTTPQIARIIGKTLPKTIAYIDRGFIKPSIRDASGHGSRREWSYLDVVRMCLIERLEDIGVNVAKMREMEELRERGIGKALTDERMAKNALMIIHAGHLETDIDFVFFRVEEDPDTRSFVPQIPSYIPMKEFNFDESPVKIIVSMHGLHLLAQKRIAGLDTIG